MALIAILQKGLTDEEEELQYKEAPTPTKKKTTKKKTTKNPPRVNKFDSMPEKDMHKELTEIDKVLWGDRKPIPRTRKSTMTKARCRICGKTENVSSSLVDSHERYKCNKCAACSG